MESCVRCGREEESSTMYECHDCEEAVCELCARPSSDWKEIMLCPDCKAEEEVTL